MKKMFLKALSLACALTLCIAPLAACDGGSGNGGNGGNNSIDKSKTQLYVANYNGGMGSRWLDEYAKGFEEKYKNVSFEDGKTGVEVVTLNDPETYKADNIYNSMDRSSINVYFTEIADYYKFAEAELLLDITDAVTTDLEGESKSIEDKLNDTQKSYYNFNGKYYGLPHYRSYRGIVYDRDLFNKEKLYIKENGQIGGKEGDSDLSAGPDGTKGTYDDGLPATYDEFFSWCNTLLNVKSITPIVWTGAYKESYTKHLLDALFANNEGAVGGNAYYNVPDSGSTQTFNVVTGFNGDEPIVESKVITKDNYAQSTHMLSSYYAIDFLQRLVSGNYFYKNSNNSTYSHEEVHYDFLHSSFDSDMQSIAMMVEGTWWEEESANIFEGMSDYEGASREERNFGFMPLPKPNATYAGGATLYDGNQSIVMVNKNCDAVHADLAKKFIRYISSEENLQLFNVMTGIGRDYDYTLTDAQYNNLSTFGQDIYDLVKNGNGIVYGYATSYAQYNWEKTHEVDKYADKEPIDEFIEGETAKALFEYIRTTNK